MLFSFQTTNKLENCTKNKSYLFYGSLAGCLHLDIENCDFAAVAFPLVHLFFVVVFVLVVFVLRFVFRLSFCENRTTDV